MEIDGYLNIKSNGSIRYTRRKVSLEYNEIAIRINLSLPDELFVKPLIEAKLEVTEDVIPKPYPIQAVVNTKELIEQKTGLKIDFQVKPYKENGKD